MNGNNNSFSENTGKTAARIMEIVSASADGITAWELKFKLHLSSSAMYLALGVLLERGKINLSPEYLTYKITSSLPLENKNGVDSAGSSI